MMKETESTRMHIMVAPKLKRDLDRLVDVASKERGVRCSRNRIICEAIAAAVVAAKKVTS